MLETIGFIGQGITLAMLQGNYPKHKLLNRLLIAQRANFLFLRSSR